jgi:hypothetical protein
MTSYEPWIGEDTTGGDGTDCRARWGPGWPACGATATIHILSESAIDGVVCLKTCEAHAPMARAAGVYVDEHSPSFPGCRCIPPAPASQPKLGGWVQSTRECRECPDVPAQSPDAQIPAERPRYGRPPFDPSWEARITQGRPASAYAADGLTHFLRAGDGAGRAVPLCAAPGERRLSRNWRVVSCPTCRLTEIP